MKTSTTNLRIGTRGSKLALAQARQVAALFPNNLCEIVTIITSGDRMQDKHLAEMGGKGLFTKELEEALFENRIDIAVHSLKDMQSILPDGLVVGAVLKREDPRDAIISQKYSSILSLPHNAIVGTSSVRRAAQLLNKRPDINIIPYRGNVTTRLEKLKNDEVDATFLALAGLNRLGIIDKIINPINTNYMLPAPCQGIISIECKKDSSFMESLRKINHEETSIVARVERSFLASLGGSCQTPIAGLAVISGNRISFNSQVLSLDGKEVIEAKREGALNDATLLGMDSGLELKSKAKHILCPRL